MKILFTHRVRSVQTFTCVAGALIVLGWVSADLQAGVYQITYTAEDLMAEANFPVDNRKPELITTATGTAIFFGPADGPPERWQKLMELPLFPAGTLLPEETYYISITINHTWILNSDGGPDWDPNFMIGDGVNLVGVATLDQNEIHLAWCQEFEVEVEDEPYWPPNGNSHQWVSYQGITSGCPQLYNPYNVSLEWEFNGEDHQTYMSVADPCGSGTVTSPVALNPAGPLTFVYVSDNQFNEQYQINSVTVTVESEGLTCNCGNPGFFDPPMEEDVIVKKGNRVIPLKFTLCDDEGYEVTDIDIASPPMAQVIYIGSPPQDFSEVELTTVGHGDEGNTFEWVSGHWQLNLQTKMFTQPGIYEISVVSTDPSYMIAPTCSVRFIIE